MASNESIISSKFRGALGKELVFRKWDGKTVVAKAPGKRNKETITSAQQEIQEKFLLASIYGKKVLADEAMSEGYRAVLKPRQNVYSRAVADFMKAPVIKKIDVRKYLGNVNDPVTIHAYDDFRIQNVTVEIRAADGSLLETGDASLHDNGVYWTYSAQQANSSIAGCTVKAIVRDVPGNETEQEMVI